MRRADALGIVLALLFASGRAGAQSPNDKTRADTLFREGERLFTAGEIAAACTSFAESQRLDPALGTLINLGLCHERQGRTATAYHELEAALAQAKSRGQDERVRLLADELAKLEPRLSRITLHPAHGDAAPSVTLDGAPVTTDAAFAIDPGTHTIVVSAPKKRVATVTVTVADASRDVDLPALEDEPVAVAVRPPSPKREEVDGGRRTVGFVLLGVAAAGVGTGVVFGIMAKSEKDTVDASCVSGQVACASRNGVDANDRAHTDATVSTIAFGVGIAAAAAGAWLVLTAPKRPTAVTLRGSRLVFEGSF